MTAAPVVLQRDRTANGLATPTRAVTKQTVEKMCEHIRNAQADPMLQAVARRTVAASKSPADQLAALWLWVKHHIKFLHDDVLTRVLFNEADHFELLISPPVMLRMKAPSGDCDDFTMLVCALACALGYEWGIVTLACDRKRPGEYSHVYGCAWLPDGTMVPLDCSHGTHPGWEVPAQDVQRKTVWNSKGQVISDEDGPAAGMGSIAWGSRTGMGAVPPGLPVIAGAPQFDTGLPIIGNIDFTNPLEWLTLGGAAASLLLANGATSKLAGAAGFLGVRFLLAQMWGTW
jgi:Transglutaminase-like superfamily